MNDGMNEQIESKVESIKWYQVPVVWLALLLFMAIIIACAHMIVVSSNLESKAYVEGEKYILGVPVNKSGAMDITK